MSDHLEQVANDLHKTLLTHALAVAATRELCAGVNGSPFANLEGLSITRGGIATAKFMFEILDAVGIEYDIGTINAALLKRQTDNASDVQELQENHEGEQ